MKFRTSQGLIRVPIPSNEERKAYEDNYARIFGCKPHDFVDGKCKHCGVEEEK